jgi:hypothetical protein
MFEQTAGSLLMAQANLYPHTYKIIIETKRFVLEPYECGGTEVLYAIRGRRTLP